MKRCFVIVTAILTAAAPCLGQDAAIDAAVERFADEIVALRHQIHQYPELGNR